MLMSWYERIRLALGAGTVLAGSLGGSVALASEPLAPAIYRCVGMDGTIQYTDVASVDGRKCRKVDTVRHVAPSSTKHTPSSRMTIAHAKKIAADALLDPEATRFRDVYRSKSGAVCGSLNAKNAHGGYVGYARFVVTPWEQVYILGQGDEYLARTAIRDNCFA